MEGPASTDRLLVVLPNWIGDVILSTPALRTLRRCRPDSHITFLVRPYAKDVLTGCPWMDELEFWEESNGKKRGLWRLTQRLKSRAYSTTLLMTNSFRTGLLAWMVGSPRRVGYARDYRSFLLTDALPVPRENRSYKIESMLDYYARLVVYLGGPAEQGMPELFTQAESDEEVERWLLQWGMTQDEPLVVLTPGASFGTSKLYPVDRFAKVGDQLAQRMGARIVISGGPGESNIAHAVADAMNAPARVVLPPELTVSRLKSLIFRARLLITNDTGPRHIAIALGTPVVTIFGSTHPLWTETHCPYERKVAIKVDCGPCQKPICPLDHRCMTGIEPQGVIDAAMELWNASNHRH